MKKTLLTTIFIAPTLLLAQTTILSDNFDSYTAGNTVAAESAGTWETWGGTAAEDADVSASQFTSSLNSMNVYNASAGNPEHDMILAFPSTYTTGTYEFRCKLYVTNNDAGYFNLGGNWPGTGGTNYEYGTDIFFNSDGSGFITNPATNDSTFSYSKNTWTTVVVSVDLDASTFELSIDGTVANSGTWSAPSGFGAVDVFGFGYTDATASTESTSNFFMDDVELVSMNVGIQELSNINLSVYPNPTNGNFTVNLNGINSGDYNLNIVDILGNLVYSEDLNVVGESTMNYDLDLSNGMYYINITDGITTTTQKIIIE